MSFVCESQTAKKSGIFFIRSCNKNVNKNNIDHKIVLSLASERAREKTENQQMFLSTGWLFEKIKNGYEREIT